jgi:hypothetical protein
MDKLTLHEFLIFQIWKLDYSQTRQALQQKISPVVWFYWYKYIAKTLVT